MKKIQMVSDDLEKLYPKWNCPICEDWFHMPYKFCKCDRLENPSDDEKLKSGMAIMNDRKRDVN